MLVLLRPVFPGGGGPHSPIETPVPVADPGFLAGSSLLKGQTSWGTLSISLPKVELKVGINVQGA